MLVSQHTAPRHIVNNQDIYMCVCVCAYLYTFMPSTKLGKCFLFILVAITQFVLKASNFTQECIFILHMYIMHYT